MLRLIPFFVMGIPLAAATALLWWQGNAYRAAGQSLSEMVKDHQTIVAAVVALFTAGLAYLAATASARAQAEARRVGQTELVEALRAEVAFRMFRVLAVTKSWYGSSANATTVDYETRLASILEDAPAIFEAAMLTIRRAWQEIAKLPIRDQRSYRKFLGEAELLIDAIRSSIFGLKGFQGQSADFYELGWSRIMESFKTHTDQAWDKAPRVKEEISRFAES
jgi:hypothetical protein